MALPTPEGGLPLVPLLHPHLMVSVAHIDLCKHFGCVQTIQHFRDEGEGKPIFDSNRVEAAVVTPKEE